MRSVTMAALVLTAIGAAATSASAGIMTESQEQIFGMPLAPGQTILTFNKFDDLDGTRVLTGVSMEMESTVSARVSAENDSELSSPEFALGLSGFVMVNMETLSTFTAINKMFETEGGVGPSDGEDGSGPDFYDFGTIGAQALANASEFNALAAYLGAGTINAVVDGTGGFSIAGATDATLIVAEFQATGSIMLTYHFETIPTPGVAALLMVAGLVGTSRRRRLF